MHPAEIKMWIRKKILSYRFADFSSDQHLAIIGAVKAHVGAYIDSPDENVRLPVRSLAQYMAQSGLRSYKSRIITEAMACVLLPLGLAWWYAASFRYKDERPHKVAGVRWNQLEYRYHVNRDVYHVPQELAHDEPKTVFAHAYYLRLRDLVLLGKVVRAARPVLPTLWLQWVFKVAKEMAWARPLLDSHPAGYALVDAEYDCALSILTLQARREGQALYNVMHGDRGRICSDSFFEVDRCYCWNQFYADQFRLLQARADFRLYENPNFVLHDNEKDIQGQGVGVFMPIEQTIPTEQDIRDFADALNRVAQRHPVHLRPHPMEINQCDRLVPYLSDKVSVCDPKAENSRQFILRHAVLVGSVSTALLESIMLKRQTVIFSCSYADDLLSYHYAYKQPNCHTCSLKALAEAIEQQL